jgi:uncharacterized Ntn-hydrolase superfamily protein
VKTTQADRNRALLFDTVPCVLAPVFCLRAALVALCPLQLVATWSLGVIDTRTKTIAVAAASCTESVYGVAGVVPGQGFVFAQAASNRRAKEKALEGIRRNISSAEILKSIANPWFDPSYGKQQYAVLTVADIDKPATFTGNDTPDSRGVRTSRGITVQGNTLVGPDVLQATFKTLHSASWADDAGLARAVMDAMAAGSKVGGDRRCGGATASSAFLTVFRASDREGSPHLNLVVRKSDAGERNAVMVLQERLGASRIDRRTPETGS